MTIVVLARHGETDWNREGIWQGHGDPPLNDLGRQQAAALVKRLADDSFDALYSSDLLRARETAEIISRSIGLPVTLDHELREIDIGSWTGLTRAQIEEQFPGMERVDGETNEAFDARAVAAVRRIAMAHAGQRVLVITHGGVVRALDRHLSAEARPVLGNCETCELRFEGGILARID